MNNVVCFAPVALATGVGVPTDNREEFQKETLRVRRLVNELPELERHVIACLFLYQPEMSVREVADRLRLTPDGVVRIEEQALAQLRRMYGTTSMFAEAA